MSDVLSGEEFRVVGGDCIEQMALLPPASVSHAVFSPPFPLLYAYTSEAADIGNSEDLAGEARFHLSCFYRQLARVMKPGRVVICHVMQIPRLKRAGGRGLEDFRGLNIRLAERAGLVFTYDWMVRKNPQSQAIRTRSRELQFAGLEKDRAHSRGALCDYLLKFEAPGENAVPVDSEGDVSRDDWIGLAEGCWRDIPETDTLNVRQSKGEGDTRHICPLQLGVYERCIRLFTNPGEVVLDPFAGLGSCGYVALGGASPVTGRSVRNPRRFLGIELRPDWREAAVRNCEDAIRQREARQKDLFSSLEEGAA